jgi:hypothetical protein
LRFSFPNHQAKENYYSKFAILEKLIGSKEEPPTKTPSISLIDIISSILLGLTEPPYWMITSLKPINLLIKEQILFASLASQVLPVPIAHIGS